MSLKISGFKGESKSISCAYGSLDSCSEIDEQDLEGAVVCIALASVGAVNTNPFGGFGLVAENENALLSTIAIED